MSAPTGRSPSRFAIGATVTADDLAGTRAPITVARLRAAEPVSWVPAIGAWLVTERAAVLAALRDPERFTVDDPRFTTGQVLGPSMLSTDGPEHRRRRSPFIAPFRAGVVARRDGPWIRSSASELIDAIRPRGRADLRTELAGPLAVGVIARTLGLTEVGPDVIGGWYRDIVAAVEALTAGRPRPAAAARAVDELRGLVEAASSPGTGPDGGGDTVLGQLARLDDDPGAAGRFADVAVVLFGAIETAEAMTANAIFHLLTEPGLLDRIEADRALIPALVEESLRLEPAAAVVDRYTTGAVPLGPDGVVIPAGDPVVLSLVGANRDPTAFPDPDRIDLTRPTSPGHLAFAAGPHACLGLHLARQETEIALATVLDRLPGLAIDRGVSTAPTGRVFRKPDRLVATWSIDGRAG